MLAGDVAGLQKAYQAPTRMWLARISRDRGSACDMADILASSHNCSLSHKLRISKHGHCRNKRETPAPCPFVLPRTIEHPRGHLRPRLDSQVGNIWFVTYKECQKPIAGERPQCRAKTAKTSVFSKSQN